jgi:hypothetical protein
MFNRLTILAAVAILAFAPLGGARAADGNDLREFRLGMKVADLPPHGYEGYSCADAADKKLESWADWKSCPADGDGMRAIGFRFDDAYNERARLNDAAAGTKVGGHPVRIALLIGQDGVVDGIRIETDPTARLYMRKKAFLMAEQVKNRYGEDGWTCTKAQPGPDDEEVGGVFLREHCEKTTDTRHFVMDRGLFRKRGQPDSQFTDETRLLILRRG